MAMATTIQILHDGQRNLIMQFSGISDGTDEYRAVKVDVSALNPRPIGVKIRKINYDIPVGIVRLEWQADDPVLLDDLTGWNAVNYKKMGGIFNNDGNNPTGNIILTTMGFEPGSNYSIMMEMVKRFP